MLRNCCRKNQEPVIDRSTKLPEHRIQPQTTNIYNDYMSSLPLHAKGWRVCRGQNPYSDNALFGKDDLGGSHCGGQPAVAYGSDRIPCSRRCMPSWHCIRAWEPVKLKSRQQKKLRTVTGAVICRKDFARKDFTLIHDRGMKRTS